MAKWLYSVFLFAALAAGAEVSGPSPSVSKLGAAHGIVVDQNGKPVAGATVFVAGSVTVLRPSAVTDAEGQFLLQNISGDLGLIAFKEADGYPFNFAAFFHSPGEQFPVVHANRGQTVENVVIRLGPKAATIKFDIRDQDGSPVAASAHFTRPDMPEIGDYGPSIQSDASLLVPAVPLSLMVEAKGYEAWHYGGADWKTDKGLLRLKPGETLNLPVRLQQSQVHR